MTSDSNRFEQNQMVAPFGKIIISMLGLSSHSWVFK
jgi:hypothetical protein